MTRKELLDLIRRPQDDGRDFTISAVTEDSRRVRRGALFVAVRGGHADGHDFAEQAVKAGAAAILGDREGAAELHGAPYVYCATSRRAAGIIAHALAGNPTRDMTVIGITGTNGKSSTAYLTQAVLQRAGHPTANFGTLGYEIAGEMHNAPHTTPFGEELALLFMQARDAGHTHVVMEVSSHALDQDRVAGIHFTAGAFTNLSQDHLDYHQDMEHYLRAKLRLFELVEGAGCFTVVNADDPVASHFIDASQGRCITFGNAGDCRATQIRAEVAATRFTMHTPWGGTPVTLRLAGRHNVWNALCATAITGGLDVPLDIIAEGLGALARVPGRFEALDAGQDFHVIVDYAHTEDGLRNVLEAARTLCRGRIITVFGCGGDRDKGKRPKMGATAARLSDFCVVTSDNPRTEDPHRILLDIEVGLQREGKRKNDDYLVIESREEAIRAAIGLARAGDLVMIAGKGHENYQIVSDQRIPFDDREVARAILSERR